MKQTIYLLLCLLSMSFFACTKEFKEINTDKSGVTDKQLEIDFNHLQVPMDVVQQGIYFNYDFGKGKNWPYQIMQNLNADMFCGYMMDYKPHNGGSHNSDYNLQEGWNGSNWLYTYAYTMPQIKRSEELTEKEYPLLYGITKLLKVETMHRIADIYGPIIYRSFGETEITVTPDTQQEAYNAFFEDLDQAQALFMADFDNEAVKSVIAKFDILLDGELNSWIRFANSLRMRLAMRIAMADPIKAKQEFLKAANNEFGVFDEPHDLVIVSTRKGYLNPLGEINRVWNEVQMNASMESILNGYEDPRRGLYFEPCVDDVFFTDADGHEKLVPLKGSYKGIRQGTGFSHLAYESHSKIYVNQTTPPILMTAAEIWFLRAEAALRGWTAEDAGHCYEQGIRCSFRQWNITSDVEEYLASDNRAADYVDAFDASNNIAARCRVTPRWIDEASQEEKLEKIITQKWIALFPEGCEAWAEQRRTGYPRLFPVRVNNSKGGTIDTEIMIRRLNFPADLATSDPTLFNALQTALGGADHGGTRLWWDKGVNF
ncbi:SusD/RagB family nutrient-binding outer membrane lipoprotein [Parabacteroides sp. OttesenSCG-928-N08]|nr:SusD/RagB family nutrient-binding outer membrane lipoprotein [Parabacteroides sp. OttesenSCG-928-N08]